MKLKLLASLTMTIDARQTDIMNKAHTDLQNVLNLGNKPMSISASVEYLDNVIKAMKNLRNCFALFVFKRLL